MATVQGLFQANNQVIDGASVSLVPASGFATPPARGDAIPSGAVASTLTGPQHGSNGAWRFTGVPGGEYYACYSYPGAGGPPNYTAFEYVNVLPGGTAASSGTATITATLSGLADGQGLTYSTGTTSPGLTGWVNTAPNYAACLSLMTAYTPSTTGADPGELVVPYSPADGTTVLTFKVRRLNWRVAASGSTSGQVVIEKSTGSGLFSPVTIGTLNLSASGFEVSVTSALGTVQSGNKVRANVISLGGATGWNIDLELGQ